MSTNRSPILCHCGGVMQVAMRQNRHTQKSESWHVCPFCQTQRRTADLEQGSAGDQVLTQPASHP